MKIIAVTNYKGGVGKTTTSVSLAAALHVLHGKRVLLVDADPQGNSTRYLLGKNVELDQHTGNAIIDKSFDGVVLETPSGVDVSPADMRLGEFDAIIQQQKNWRLRLSNALDTVRDHYDFAIIDCPPLLGTFCVMALVAANAYLAPTEPEQFASDGLERLTELTDEIQQRLNPELTFLGICVTRYNSNLRHSTHSQIVAGLRDTYGEANMLPSIREQKTVADSVAQSTSIFHVNPASTVAQDYAALANTVLARLS